jgi:5-methylcytosine-specific restriction protein A
VIARKSRHQRGYTNKWAKVAKQYLAEHPWCKACAQIGRKTPATEVDHIVRHQGDQRLFWRRDNWQQLCKPCHSSKTRDEMLGRDSKPKGCDVNGMSLEHTW